MSRAGIPRGRIIRGQGRAGTEPAKECEQAPLGAGAPRVVRDAEQRAQRRADARLAEAERKAEALLARAREEARRLRQDAVEQGRAEATRALLGAQQRAQRQLDEAEAALTTLAVQIAERLLDRELDLAPDAIADVVARALEAARGSQQAVVRVSPADLPTLEAMISQHHGVTLHGITLKGVTLEADPAIRRGGCLVETPAGQIDGRIEPQLAAIRATLCPGDEEQR